MPSCCSGISAITKRGKRLDTGETRAAGLRNVLKAAHTFNLLDARAPYRLPKRAAYIGRIATSRRSVSQSYFDSRLRGFPECAPASRALGMTSRR